MSLVKGQPVQGDDGTNSGLVPGNNYGVWGDVSFGSGVIGTSTYVGVVGQSDKGSGVVGDSQLAGKVGQSFGGTGVSGGNSQQLGIGVSGEASQGIGVWSLGNIGVESTGNTIGITSFSDQGAGVTSQSNSSIGIYGESDNGLAISAYGGDIGVYASNKTVSGNEVYLSAKDVAGNFHGDISVSGSITKSGGGFQIDHPLEPASKYLSHSFVESSDMKNIYDGVVVLDQNGKAEVHLPEWFGALNKDFRYQLTAIGAPGPNIYIEEEISAKNHFKIAGGKQGMKVSWQVTGIRKDRWAEAHRIKVEHEKPHNENGYYLHPQLYDKPSGKDIVVVRYSENVQRLKKVFDIVELINKNRNMTRPSTRPLK